MALTMTESSVSLNCVWVFCFGGKSECVANNIFGVRQVLILLCELSVKSRVFPQEEAER